MPRIALYNPNTNSLFKATVGILKDSGDRFTTEVEPFEVIKYTPLNPAGLKLTRVTTTPNTGQWQYLSGSKQVLLGDTLQQGETVVAVIGSESVFDTALTLANTTYFDVSQSDESYRTKLQKVRMVWVGAGEELQNVVISTEDLLTSTGSDQAHYYLAADDNGQPGTFKTTLTSEDIPELASIKWLQEVTFWVKCVKPIGTSVGSFADVVINISGTRFKYPRQQQLLSSTSWTTIPTNLSSKYYVLFFRYVRVSGIATDYNFPYLFFNSSESRLYIRAHNTENIQAGNITEFHYILQPIQHLVTAGKVTEQPLVAETISIDSSFASSLLKSFVLNTNLNILRFRFTSGTANDAWYFQPAASLTLFTFPLVNFPWLYPNTNNAYSQLYSYFGEATMDHNASTLQTTSTSGLWTVSRLSPFSLFFYFPYRDSGFAGTVNIDLFAPFAESLDASDIFMRWDATQNVTVSAHNFVSASEVKLYQIVAP